MEKEIDDLWFLFLFSVKDGKLNGTKISYDHRGTAFLSSLIIDGREKLVVGCMFCDDLKLLDLQTEEWKAAFTGCYPWNSCPGGSSKILVQALRSPSILQPDFIKL